MTGINIATFGWIPNVWSQNAPPILPPQAITSYVLVDLETGQILDSLNIDQIQPIASVAKIMTTLIALEQLGPDFRFETTLLANGPIDQGILQGDLLLWGGGDPFLSSDDLATLTQSLNQAPLRQVTGNFYYGDLASLPAEINPLQPMAAPYNPGISPLSVDFNRIWVKSSPSLLPHATHVPVSETYAVTDQRLIPTPWIKVLWPADQQYHHRFIQPPFNSSSAGTLPIFVGEEWQLPLSEKEQMEWLPVKHPAHHSAYIFQTLAAHQGSVLPNPLPLIRQALQSLPTLFADGRVIARHYSPMLSKIIPLILHYSNNISAELLGYQLLQGSSHNHLLAGCVHSDCITRYFRAWAQANLPHLNWQDLEIHQFSGLGHANRLTGRQMAAILEYLWHHPKEYAVLRQGLSIPPFLSTSPIASHIQVKTGTLVGVSIISGYLLSSRHRPLAFFIASHNPQEISNLLVAAGNRSPFSSATQRQWQQQTRQFQKELLEYWVTTH